MQVGIINYLCVCTPWKALARRGLQQASDQKYKGYWKWHKEFLGKKKYILAINNPHAALRSEIHEEGLHWAIFILRLLLLG